MNFSGVSQTSLIGRAARLPLRLIPPSVQMPILQGPLRGNRWIVGSCSHGCWLGSYEYITQRAFAAELRRGYAVYDLGANVGFYSLLASVLVGEVGQVFSFEPVERNLHYLRRHMELNKATNCSIWNVAIGRSDGTGQFDMGIDYASGHLTAAKHSGTFDVRIVSLDSLVASGQLPPPNLIKCDIEGAEYDALVGAAGIIIKHRPVIFLATHGPYAHEQCCTMLSDLNYVIAPLEYYGADQQLLAKPN